MSMRPIPLLLLTVFLAALSLRADYGPPPPKKVNIARLFDEAELIAVVRPEEHYRYNVVLEEIIYQSPDSKIEPINHNGQNHLHLVSNSTKPKAYERHIPSAVAVSGYSYIAFFRRHEGSTYFPSLDEQTEKRFTTEAQVAVVYGCDSFIAIADSESIYTDGLVEIYMSKINGAWKDEQPADIVAGFANILASEIDYYGVEHGDQVLAATKAIVAWRAAEDEEAKARIVEANQENPAFETMRSDLLAAAKWGPFRP